MKTGLLALTLLCAFGASAIKADAFERRISGRTARELFPDQRLADLATAACSGNSRRVAKLVATGVDPNGHGREGALPLIWAVRCQNVRGVEGLLTAGADPNLAIDDVSATYLAAQEPAKVLEAILDGGGDPSAGSGHRSALIEAMSLGINEGGWANYYALLDAGADINRVYGVQNTIALFAADMAQYEKLGELLDRGYDRDLQRLAAHVQSRVVRPDLEPARANVKAMLESRGVKFPVPPLRPLVPSQ